MSMLEQFQKLDDIIFELTEPPVRTRLRNQLALTREQVEAHQAASDRQDQTLQRQAETIEALQNENVALKKKIADADDGAARKQRLSDWFDEQRRKQTEMRRRHSLNYDV
jgi:hypothetical protein